MHVVQPESGRLSPDLQVSRIDLSDPSAPTLINISRQLLIILYSFTADLYLAALCMKYVAYLRLVECINQRVCHRLVWSQFVDDRSYIVHSPVLRLQCTVVTSSIIVHPQIDNSAL